VSVWECEIEQDVRM